MKADGSRMWKEAGKAEKKKRREELKFEWTVIYRPCVLTAINCAEAAKKKKNVELFHQL